MLLFAVAVVVLTVLAVGAVLLLSPKPAQAAYAGGAPSAPAAARPHARPGQPTEMARALQRELDEQEIDDAAARLRREHQRRELQRIALPAEQPPAE